MEAKVGPYMVNDLFSIIEDIADDVYGEEMKDEIAKPVIEAVTKAFKASIKREVKKFYNSDSSSVETNEENSTDLVQKRFEHLLKSRQIYCSLDSQYLPYFTDIKDQCASFFIFKLKDGNEVSLLNELFVDRNNSSLQGLFKLKTSIEHFGLSKLLINTYTSEQLKSASINPLFGKKSTPQDIKTKFPLYAGDISCLIAFLYSVICQYIQRIQKHVSMGPHNAEDYVREYSIDKEDLWVSREIPPCGNHDWFHKYYMLMAVYEHDDELLNFSEKAIENPFVILRNPSNKKDIDVARIIAKGILPFEQLVRVIGKELGVLKEFSVIAHKLGSFAYPFPSDNNDESDKEDDFLSFLDNGMSKSEHINISKKLKSHISSFIPTTLKNEFLNYKKYVLSNYDEVLERILKDRNFIREHTNNSDIFFKRQVAEFPTFGFKSEPREVALDKTEILCVQSTANSEIIYNYIKDCEVGNQIEKILPCVLQYLSSLQVKNDNISNKFYYSVREFEGWDEPMEDVQEKAYLRSVEASAPKIPGNQGPALLTEKCVNFVNYL